MEPRIGVELHLDHISEEHTKEKIYKLYPVKFDPEN